MYVVALGDECARPFVHAACKRYEVAFDPDSGTEILWWGGIERNGVQAVVGWSIGEEDDEILLTGPFGSGNRLEEVWMNELLRAMSRVRARFVIIPASPSLYIRRQSAQLERYGVLRCPPQRKAL